MKKKALRIWVVEDEAIYQNLLISYLQMLGHEVKGFSSGEECIDALKTKPELIILDRNLGDGINGVDVLQIVREWDRDIFVLVISAQQKHLVDDECMQIGSDEYIEKDSASLLRIKLHVERIQKVVMLRRKKKISHLVWGIFAGTFFLSLLYYFVLWL